MKKLNTISCPNCGELISTKDAITHEVEEQLQVELGKREKALKAEQEEQVSILVEEETSKIEEKLQKKLVKKNAAKLQELEQENEESEKRIREMEKAELAMIKKEKELKDKEQGLELKMEKTMQAREEEIEKKARANEVEKVELRFKEYDKQIEDQKKLVEEMRRKAEQGSMQMQGEVQELAIEEYLEQNFPYDTIEDIKTGARGADCLQVVHSEQGVECGKIYYESKRTKDFQKTWIEKFKEDMRAKGADIGILVTEVMPKDMDRFGEKEGIWICNLADFKGLCHVLRASLLNVSQAMATQSNKGDKMSMLYDYMTGNEFRQQIEAIVEGFGSLEVQILKEKKAMASQWKEREKQLQKVLGATMDMYGSVKGIAGSAVGTIKALEMGAEDTEDNLLDFPAVGTEN